MNLFIIHKEILRKSQKSLLKEIRGPGKVQIDFMILELTQLKELRPLEEVPSLEEESGRENPFIPY